MLWLDVDDEPLQPGAAGDALLAAFFVPRSPRDVVPTVEEWARRANIGSLEHTQYGSKPDHIFTRGVWGGTVSCEFYVACLEEHTCIMIGLFYRAVHNLTSPSENPNPVLTEPPTWPLVQLFQQTCLSLEAEVLLVSYWPEHANLRWVRQEYPLVLRRDAWDLAERGYGLLYTNGKITGAFSPLFLAVGPRDSVEVEGGGLLLFAESGRNRWVNTR